VAKYLVIVHPAGWVDFEKQPAYWSEVPGAPACAATGDTIAEVVDRTREQLVDWFGYLRKHGRPVPGTDDLSVDVMVAA